MTSGFVCAGSEGCVAVAVVHAQKRVCVVGIDCQEERAPNTTSRAASTATEEPALAIRVIACLPEMRDWVWDAIALPSPTSASPGGDGRIALALGHNTVELWSVSAAGHHRLRVATSEEHCLLYSAKFFGTTEETLLLASGKPDKKARCVSTYCCPGLFGTCKVLHCSLRPSLLILQIRRDYIQAGVAVAAVC